MHASRKPRAIARNARPIRVAVTDAIIVYVLSVFGLIGTNALIYRFWPQHVHQAVGYGPLLSSQCVIAFSAGLLSYYCTSNVRRTNRVRSVWRSFLTTTMLVAGLGVGLWVVGGIVSHDLLPIALLGALSQSTTIAPLGYRRLGFVRPTSKLT